jgi:2,3-bisphosphoglycerate-independent phosphoglycerate mutase
MLVIMDGCGIADPGKGNAISCAHTPFLDSLFATCPHAVLQASGEPVGLPDGQMGNSEVGHLNIGAGRVMEQELTRINHACADGSIANNPKIKQLFATVAQHQSVLHLMGLLSDGGVHSSIDHLYALMDAACAAGVTHIAIHCFTDGRDVSPTSGITFIRSLEQRMALCEQRGCSCFIASISGRYYAMDRDHRWDRVQAAYSAIAAAQPYTEDSPLDYMKKSYADDVTDEFVHPVAFSTRGVKDGDGVLFFNFRPDRARELTRAFIDSHFDDFDRSVVSHISFVCMTEYDESFDVSVAFAKDIPDQTFAQIVSEQGLKQFHIAETEKYAHVTFFLNGGREKEFPGEHRELIPSPKVATYDLQPQMSEPKVADRLTKAIESDEADVYIVNFANGDMVGHTGSIPATIQAVQAVDTGVASIITALRKKGGYALITADHGNADKMLDEKGNPFTAHSLAPVPLILVNGDGPAYKLISSGSLCDIAPTLLEIMGIQRPDVMTGHSMLVK